MKKSRPFNPNHMIIKIKNMTINIIIEYLIFLLLLDFIAFTEKLMKKIIRKNSNIKSNIILNGIFKYSLFDDLYIIFIQLFSLFTSFLKELKLFSFIFELNISVTVFISNLFSSNKSFISSNLSNGFEFSLSNGFSPPDCGV